MRSPSRVPRKRSRAPPSRRPDTFRPRYGADNILYPSRFSTCPRRLSAGGGALRAPFAETMRSPSRVPRKRSRAHLIVRSAPSVEIQTPSFPSGIPPPRGIGDSPRIMHDKREYDTHAHRGALTEFERRALPAEFPARGEEFGRAHYARACLERGRRATLKERAATFKRRLRRL